MRQSHQKEKDYLSMDDVFDTNSEYFIKMMNIVDRNSRYPKVIAKGRELHHIIERNFSKLKKKDIDNRESNLVSLTKVDHCIIHFYAWKCVKKEFKSGAARAVTFMRRNLIGGDVGKNEFIINMLAESNDLLNADADRKKYLAKGRKKRKGSITLDLLDALTAEIMCNISRGRVVGDLYNKLGIIGKTHSFKTRYVRNGMKDVYKEMPDLKVEPLIEIIHLIFGDICKTWRNTDNVLYNNCVLYSFITWYLTEYHCSELYDETDTIADVIDKYNTDIAYVQYEEYLDSLEDCVDVTGVWFNDGITEKRFKYNPDPSYWKPGRLNTKAN